jgi:hypothetical protein
MRQRGEIGRGLLARPLAPQRSRPDAPPADGRHDPEEVTTVIIPDLDAISDKVLSYRTRYGDPNLSPGAVLCDDHPFDAVAFTLVRPDGTTADLTYGRLGELSTT